MKKLSLLIALALIVTIGGVYASWVYIKNDDVADITGAKAITMTEATFDGNYGTFGADLSNLSLKVDPKPNTSHVTSLVISGSIKITFTPNANADETIKTQGLPNSTFKFSLSNPDWKYNGEDILTIDTEVHDIVWGGPDENGVFTYEITAEALEDYITLTEFTLDTKSDYDAYDAVLTNGQIVISISDGKHSDTPAS